MPRGLVNLDAHPPTALIPPGLTVTTVLIAHPASTVPNILISLALGETLGLVRAACQLSTHISSLCVSNRPGFALPHCHLLLLPIS
ncbi:hypothetical protein FJTKL_00643 [Diaporthe vaccinii]|uniref:Uncharacterized protein n=1 Tax=Diaporthe vaccinii TaxID=105482 RepID=A0ABR4F630_9PEZI